MTQSEFDKLSTDLRKIAQSIPLHWGAVQNNRTDDRINMFEIHTYEALERAVAPLSEDARNYLRRRWYIWKCAECDEYLFYKNEGVIKNPDKYDKAWDISIYDKYFFDVKGTVVPRGMREDMTDDLTQFGCKMVEFFYDKQSHGRRFDMQNRLFIVHHSFVDERREFYLRCAWQTKEKVYAYFIEHIEDTSMYYYVPDSFEATLNRGENACQAAVIYLIEEVKGQIIPFIPGIGALNI